MASSEQNSYVNPLDALSRSHTRAGALVVDITCAFILARYQTHKGSLSQSAPLSARNDAFANIAILVAAAITVWAHTACPDIAVRLGIIALNSDAAWTVWRKTRQEQIAS